MRYVRSSPIVFSVLIQVREYILKRHIEMNGFTISSIESPSDQSKRERDLRRTRNQSLQYKVDLFITFLMYSYSTPSVIHLDLRNS